MQSVDRSGPFRGCLYYALIGLPQATGLAGGYDCALSREIPLICDFSENFQKSMSFFCLRCCGKGVEELLKNLQFDVVFEASHVAVK